MLNLLCVSHKSAAETVKLSLQAILDALYSFQNISLTTFYFGLYLLTRFRGSSQYIRPHSDSR